MIFAIKPFEIHDGDGIRTTVFFKGCPLRCKWCHNPEAFSAQQEMLYDSALCKNCMKCVFLCESNTVQNGVHFFQRESCTLCGKCQERCLSEALKVVGQNRSAEEIAKQVLMDEIIMKGSGGGVTFSGGEPLMQVDLCVEIAKLLKQRDINIAIDTCGFVSKEAIDKILPYADTFLFDIKAIDESVHIACTGVSNKRILGNIKYVDSLGIPMEIRYPYVPAWNDGEAEKIADFVKELRNVKCIRVLKYHNYAEQKYTALGLAYALSDLPVPTEEDVSSAIQKMKKIAPQTRILS